VAKILGIDIGSVNAKAVLLDDTERIRGSWETRSRGCATEALHLLLEKALKDGNHPGIKIGLTGSGREQISSADEIFTCNEIVALAVGASMMESRARSVIEVGGQSTRWLHLEDDTGEVGNFRILDFVLNERCAAGSGAFIEQQAARLKLDIEEFSRLATQATSGAPVAGRCSVFAKSDMIHLQQKGTPVEEITYGLCLAVARNFIGTILKGKRVVPPVLFAGGGAKNGGLVRAFQEVLKLKGRDFLLTQDPSGICALGAALGAKRYGRKIRLTEKENISSLFKAVPYTSRMHLTPLGAMEAAPDQEPCPAHDEYVTGFVGVDVGSVSTNLVVLDEKGEVRAGVYLPTRGRPLEVIREGFERLFEKCRGGLEILGIGTTGSGRYLAGRFLKADVIHNEITTQMMSAHKYFPEADTVFEIGGQDSKYIHMRAGRIHDFTMNKICSAGTGSFLEEQAEQMNIGIEHEFSMLASRSSSPHDLGCRCTVFMDTELAGAVGRGLPVSDIAAGLAYSIARNYLEKVVGNRPVGESIVFQGGVASNPAAVRAFSLILGKEIRVHPYNRISGAIGAALMAAEKVDKSGKISPPTELLRERIRRTYKISSFECRECSNSCQVNRIAIGEETIYFGDTCERYTTRKQVEEQDEVSAPLDLFKIRQQVLFEVIRNPENPEGLVGLPVVSFMVEYLPFWAGFFNHLGFGVLPSPSSGSAILEEGLKRLPAETCLPIKLAFGHTQWFSNTDVDWVFFPSLIEPKPHDSVPLCPYAENIPFMVKSTVELEILTPSVDLSSGPDTFVRGLSPVKRKMQRSTAQLKEAFHAAVKVQQEYYSQIFNRGKDLIENALSASQDIWIVLGKPYNIHDGFANLNLARHMRNLGVLGVPMDFLDLDGKTDGWPDTPAWRFNQSMMEAALWSCEQRNVYPVIVSNFGCGPDAFMLKHLSRILKDRPHLFLEFDEHRAEAGLITRLEAFFDEVNAKAQIDDDAALPLQRGHMNRADLESLKERRFVLPHFADHAYAFAGALRAVSIEAECLPPPDEKTVSLGERHSSGKECHPYSILAGDLLKLALSERQGDEVFFFPGSRNNCLLHQYGAGMSLLLEEMGISDIEVLAPPTSMMVSLFGMEGITLLWRGLVAIDLLVKAACEKRPYEVKKGITERIHKKNLKDIEIGLAERDFHGAINRCVERLNDIEVRWESRPLVGIAGDIYTRQNPVGNHDLFLKLEELGCEVWPSPFLVDGVDFRMRRDMSQAMLRRRFHESAAIGLLYLKKELETWKVKKDLRGSVHRITEPTFKQIKEFTSPYIGMENNDILLMNIAKMVDFARRGADGVINAICFNCMLGTISEAIASRIRRDCRNIPIPTLIFSGKQTPTEKTKIEAFIFQVQQYAQRKKSTDEPTRSESGRRFPRLPRF
jgi:predicted CoA-substrate-specific enzyme activase